MNTVLYYNENIQLIPQMSTVYYNNVWLEARTRRNMSEPSANMNESVSLALSKSLLRLHMMKREKMRLESFTKYYGPNKKYEIIDAKALAADGIYHIDDGNRMARCAFCFKYFDCWQKWGNEGHFYHSIASPKCPLLNKVKCGNITLKAESLGINEALYASEGRKWMNLEKVLYKPRREYAMLQYDTPYLADIGVYCRFPYKDMRMVKQGERFKALCTTTPTMKHETLKELANAGFYRWDPEEAIVRCYLCDVGLKLENFKPGIHDPYELHCFGQRNCTHVIMMKGVEFWKKAIKMAINDEDGVEDDHEIDSTGDKESEEACIINIIY